MVILSVNLLTGLCPSLWQSGHGGTQDDRGAFTASSFPRLESLTWDEPNEEYLLEPQCMTYSDFSSLPSLLFGSLLKVFRKSGCSDCDR